MFSLSSPLLTRDRTNAWPSDPSAVADVGTGPASRPAPSGHRRGSTSVDVSGDSVTYVLRVTVELLVLGTFIAQLMKANGTALGVARFVDADVKVNLPTGFKVFALATSALLAWAIGRAAATTGDRWARRWTQMAIVIGFLVIDEIAYVHQSLASFTGSRGGLLHYSWVLVYLPAAALVGVLFLPFVLALRPELRIRIVLAGLLFGGGSGGVELVKSKLVHSSGEESLSFYLTTAVSDSLEMIGLAVLIVALLAELRRRTPTFELRLSH